MSVPDKSYEDDAPYVCTLSAATLKKAQEELHEDPKNRMDAVKQLREWIKRQPHLTCRTDNQNMIRFLRGAKFSQIRAREMLEGYYALRTKYPNWFCNIDTMSKKIHYIIDQGYYIPLPGTDKQGRRVLLERIAALKIGDKNFELEDILHTQMCLQTLVYRQEETQVHGTMMVGDHTDASLKHMMRFPMEDMKNFMKAFQKAVPGRFKAFHVYNAGTIMESMMAIMRPVLTSKFMNRIKVHSNLESLYKEIPMEMLPVEYLPDDYKGPNAGTIKEICDVFLTPNDVLAHAVGEDDLKKQIMTDEFRAYMLYESNERFGVDASKKPKDAALEGAFRKLNVD